MEKFTTRAARLNGPYDIERYRIVEARNDRGILLQELVGSTQPVDGVGDISSDPLGEVLQASCTAVDELHFSASEIHVVSDLLCACLSGKIECIG